MTSLDWFSIVAIILCLLLSFFFAGSETALMAFSRARMLRLEEKGNRSAGIVNRLLDSRPRRTSHGGARARGAAARRAAARQQRRQHPGFIPCHQRVPALVRRRRRGL